MKFTVPISAFQNILTKVLPAIPRKSTLPVLEHLNFTLEGNNLKVIGTDQDIIILSRIEVVGDSNGKILVPARLLSEIVKALGSVGDLEFSSNEESFDITIKTVFGKYDMKGLNPDEYLELPELFTSEKPEMLVDNDDSKNNIPAILFDKELITRIANKTVFAVSNDEYRPAMNGVLFQIKGAILNAVSTDSFRLVRLSVQLTNSSIRKDLEIIIPARAIELLRRIDDDAIMSVIESNDKITHVRFDVGNSVFISRLIDQKFPPYESVIPTNNEKRVVISQPELLKSIKRISIFTMESTKQLRLKFVDGKLNVVGENEDSGNKANDIVHCDYTGADFQIGFNVRYLEEAVQNIVVDKDEKFVMTFSEPTKPALIKPGDESEDLLMLIMPVRI